MSDIESKPKRVLTEEQKAKMKAGREAAKIKREAEKASGVETPKKTKSDSESSDAASTTSSKTKRVLTDEQKAKMKAGREAAKAKRETDKAAGVEAPKKSALTKKIWESVLNEVKKDLKPEFEAYVKSKLE
jgi:Spy/CpxP family protein refolding chaperone